jgi:predicted DNA-binding ribbon-helix-helix protein
MNSLLRPQMAADALNARAATFVRPSASHALSTRKLLAGGHKISLRLELGFWRHLDRIAAERRQSTADFIAAIDATRHSSLRAALRLAVIENLEGRCGLRPAHRSVA